MKFPLMLIVLVTLLLVLPFTPVTGCSEGEGKKQEQKMRQSNLSGVFTATDEPQSLLLNSMANSGSLNHQFIITSDWQAVTVLQFPVIYESTGITEELEVHWSLENTLFGDTTLARNEGFKLVHGFKGSEIITITLDSAREMHALFEGHGFIYNLETEFAFRSFDGLVEWTMNFTVLQPVIYTFNPVDVTTLQVNGSNLSIDCFPPALILTGSSMNGFYGEFLFFVGSEILLKDEFLVFEIIPEIESLESSISRVKVKNQITGAILLDETGGKDVYSLQLKSLDGNIAGIAACMVIIEFTGAVTETVLTAKVFMTVSREKEANQPFSFEEIFFDPLPQSLHIPLLLFSLSPLGIFTYRVKKEHYQQKAVLEE